VQGNILAVYYGTSGGGDIGTRLTLKEQNVYGSSRLGVYNRNTVVYPVTVEPLAFTRGNKYYELSNHLGNVNSVISDRKIQTATAGIYLADIKSYTDYYPFGYRMPGRIWIQDDYRYSFNGQEKDNEIYGGNSTTAEYWQYDTRLGRRWNVEPLASKYPFISPYAVFGGNPIRFIDPKGNFPVDIHYDITYRALGKFGLHYIEKRNIAWDASVTSDLFFMKRESVHLDNYTDFDGILKVYNSAVLKTNIAAKNENFNTKAAIAMHTILDFYSHSNYVSIYMEYLKKEKLPFNMDEVPTLQDVLKDDKYSGFRDMLQDQLRTGTYGKGADKDALEYHDNMSLDSPNKGMGKKPVEGTEYNYHDVGVKVSEKALKQALEQDEIKK
jgi:RHS repeat-associated protein